jgi:hypothetical protein
MNNWRPWKNDRCPSKGNAPSNAASRPRNPIYRRIDEMTADGQVAREHFGNGLRARYDHIACTGQLRGVKVTDAGISSTDLTF